MTELRFEPRTIGSQTHSTMLVYLLYEQLCNIFSYSLYILKRNHGIGHQTLGSLMFSSFSEGRIPRSGEKSEGILFIYNRNLNSRSHAFSLAAVFLPSFVCILPYMFCLLNFICPKFPTRNINFCLAVLYSGYKHKFSRQAAEFKNKFLHLLFNLGQIA